VSVDDVEHDVEVDTPDDPATQGSTLTVLVDGVTHHVHPTAGRAWRVDVGGTTHHTVHLEPGPRPTAAQCGERRAAIDVRTAAEAALADAIGAAADAAGGGGAVESPMPGRVVRVLVDTGQSVERDQPLVIVEAMKMENEVRAPAAGVVERIGAAAGEAVEAGHLLIELAPHPDSA
jgi:biotin carboxyl carrier protein